MRLLNSIKKHYEKLLLVPIVLMILIIASMAGIGYSALTSDVINSGNTITFTKIGGQVIPDDNTNTGTIVDIIETPTTIIVDGEEITLPTYEITPNVNLNQHQPLDFELVGEFCIWLDINKKITITIDTVDYEVKTQGQQVTGYFVLVGGAMVKRTLTEIINNDLWITTTNITTFSFHQKDAVAGATILKVVFKE